MKNLLLNVLVIQSFFSCSQNELNLAAGVIDANGSKQVIDYRVEGAISYEINSGGSEIGSFMPDEDLNLKWKVLEDGRAFKTFGIANSISKKEIVRGQSTPEYVPLEIFESLRYDKLDEAHHAPGIDYRFKVSEGVFVLQVHFLMSSSVQKIRIANDLNANDIIVEVPIGPENTTFTYTTELNIKTNQDVLNLSFFPNYPDLSLTIAGVGLYAQSRGTELTDHYLDLETRYISVNSSGLGDGSSWQNAGNIGQLNNFISDLSATGGVIYIDNESGDYNVSSSFNLTNGSDANTIFIIGRGQNDVESRSVFKGTRTSPWPSDGSGNSGNEYFRVYKNAKNLIFKNLEFQNFGNGVFRILDEISNISFEEITIRNVTRFVENYYSGAAQGATASFDGLTIKYLDIRGYSRGVMRALDSSKNIEIAHVFADSEQQVNSDSSAFSQGFHFDDTVSNVLLRKVTSINHFHSNGSSYWNADSFVAEKNVKNISLLECIAAGNTDGGVDSKSGELTIERMVALDNKRNYRLWGDTIIKESFSLSPYKRGGSGDSIHIGVYNENVNLIEVFDMSFMQSNASNPLSEEGFLGILRINNGTFHSTDSSALENRLNGYNWLELNDPIFTTQN